MNNPSILPRRLLIFVILVPLAAFLGYLLADPDFGSFILIGGFVCLLLSPIFLRWHHLILVASWNLWMVIFFLPGGPPFWMLTALISLGITLLHKILDKQKRLCGVPSVTWSLIVLGLVVLFTMKVTGGLALRSMGGTVYGGRKYFYVLLAIVGYFALSTQPIPLQKAKGYASAFLLGGLSSVMSNLIYFMGPGMWVLYNLFSVDFAVGQAVEDFNAPYEQKLGRLAGMGPAGLAVFFLMLARYGVGGVLDWTKPWRIVILAGAIGVSSLGGFRSLIILAAAIVAIQFFLEGLHRTRLLPIMILTGTVLLAVAFPMAKKMPLAVQRCLSVLPVEVDPAVRADAKNSTDWRLQMWEVLLPEVPQYLWVGKGCAVSATDYYLAIESFRRGLSLDYEFFIVAGDYHNGPLSVLIPFGLPGALAFAWFLIMGGRVLHRNYRYGDPGLKTINTFLYACFLARVFFYLVVFGGFHGDIVNFIGLVGFSVSLNRGMRRVTEPLKQEAATSDKLIRFKPSRAF